MAFFSFKFSSLDHDGLPCQVDDFHRRHLLPSLPDLHLTEEKEDNLLTDRDMLYGHTTSLIRGKYTIGDRVINIIMLRILDMVFNAVSMSNLGHQYHLSHHGVASAMEPMLKALCFIMNFAMWFQNVVSYISLFGRKQHHSKFF